MSRILAIDFGGKRCGIAETDDLKLIASPLTTVHTAELLAFLMDYHKKYVIEKLVVGLPLRSSGEVSAIEEKIGAFLKKFVKQFPGIEVERQDESHSSSAAVSAMIQAGVGKEKRRVKENVDKVSAAIILQRYMGISY